MKIEKVNENQIRCTLTKQDLAERQITLREFAYGTEKARGLFNDMIEEANNKFGFDVDDEAIMVEAIPMPSDALVLLITKVDDPEELDARFSQFTDELEDLRNYDAASISHKAADDIVELFEKLRRAKEAMEDAAKETDEPLPVEVPDDLTKIFEFRDMKQLEQVSHILADCYDGHNDLYKNAHKERFYLLIHKDCHTPEEFNKVCNILSEYATEHDYSPATAAYFAEHGEKLAGSHALQALASL